MTVRNDNAINRDTPPSLARQEGEGFGVIWDMDGTMVDTAELHFQAWKETAAELGRPFTREDFQATFGRRNPDILHILFGERFSEAEIAALGNRKEEKYRAAARHGVELLPGVGELLAALHASGFRQAIGSSAPRANLELILNLTGTQQFFHAIVGMEDVQRGKPDPQVFLVAAERVQIAPQKCLVLEDAVAGVQAAKAGGMKCIAVRFVGHHGETSLREAGAERVVETLREVTANLVRNLWI